MLKPALLLGTMLLSLNAVAASVTELNTALQKASMKSAQPTTKMTYAGRDVKDLLPEVVPA